MRLVRRVGFQLIQDRADCVHDLKVGGLVVPPHVITLAGSPVLQHGPDRIAVVFNVQPVADLLPVTVDRQGLAFQRIHDH